MLVVVLVPLVVVLVAVVVVLVVAHIFTAPSSGSSISSEFLASSDSNYIR